MTHGSSDSDGLVELTTNAVVKQVEVSGADGALTATEAAAAAPLL